MTRHTPPPCEILPTARGLRVFGFFAAMVVACQAHDEGGEARRGALQSAQAVRVPASSAPDEAAVEGRVDSARAPTDGCRRRWEEVLRQPSLPGAPSFESRRATLLARAKAEPLLFLDTPRWADASSPTVASYRRHLASAAHHWDVLAFQLGRFLGRPDIGREVLLKDGYLYSEHPHMAYAMDQQVKPRHLFDSPRIWIQRGDRVYWARRTAEGYVYENTTPEEPVTLLHLDRLGEGTPKAPLHVDVRALRQQLHFDSLRVVHLTSSALLAELRYEDVTMEAVLDVDGASLKPSCEIEPAAGPEAYGAVRRRNETRFLALQRLQRAMHDQVLDALPFDEPREEVGVQDGALRHRWVRAYEAGRGSFQFEGERYDVFNRRGRPRPPQVCVDFVTDTFDRASGSWWNPRGEPRARNSGELDLSSFELLRSRRVPDLIRFAETRVEWFELRTIAPSERIPLGRRNRFFEHLKNETEPYHVGDVVIVRGPTPDDSEHMHYHSFFIYETDPISSVPIAVVGNAGYPHIWSLESESRRAPKRSIWHRIRPLLPLLETIGNTPAATDTPPSPLVEEAL